MNFEIAKARLEEGCKVKLKCWRYDCFIIYNNHYMGCYDEKGDIINLKTLSHGDFEVVDDALATEKVTEDSR